MYLAIWVVSALVTGFIVGMWGAVLTVNSNTHTITTLSDYVSLTFTIIGGSSGIVGIMTAIYIYRGWKIQHKYGVEYEVIFNTEDYFELLFSEHHNAIEHIIRCKKIENSGGSINVLVAENIKYQEQSKLASISEQYGLHYRKLLRLGFSETDLNEIYPKEIHEFFNKYLDCFAKSYSEHSHKDYLCQFECQQKLRREAFAKLRRKLANKAFKTDSQRSAFLV